MKPHVPLLAVSALLLAACVSPLPLQGLWATATPTLTPTPTRTPTPTLTPTPTITPTPSLPPEALTRLAGRDWRIEGNKVVAGDVAWYTLSPEGWRPAQFVADFDSYQFSLEGLEIADEDGVVRIYDPNAGDEAARLVYEDGKVNILFAVERAKEICTPTEFRPVFFGGKNNYEVASDQEEAYSDYLISLIERGGKWEIFKVGRNVLIDEKNRCWGFVITEEEKVFLFEVGRDSDRRVITVPLMKDWHIKWFGFKDPFDYLDF